MATSLRIPTPTHMPGIYRAKRPSLPRMPHLADGGTPAPATPLTGPYQPYQAPVYTGGTVGYSSTNDPRALAANERAVIQSQGDQYQGIDQQLANQYATQASGTQGYLNQIENPLAQGQGGYNSSESSQIELNPDTASKINLDPATAAKINLSDQDKQNIVTGAGISAGAGTASAVGAAERAAAAAGGNPAALATYRARAAQTQGANAGDAMTQARIGAKQAESTDAAKAQELQSSGAATAQQLQASGAENVGQARLGQQNTALNYYGGLQQEQNQNALAEQGLGQQAYGTEVGGTTSAAKTGLEASQTPSTTDKIIGGIAGAASAFLEDGKPGYLDDGGMDAVVGENGPEAIVAAASDPVRSHTTFMADGSGYVDSNDVDSGQGSDAPAAPAAGQPWWKKIVSMAGSGGGQPAAPSQSQQKWNPTTPWSQLGGAVGGGLAKLGSSGYLADGSMAETGPGTFKPGASGPMAAKSAMSTAAPQIITKPTMVHLEKADMVVPLSYRPKAKVRPSAALPALARGGAYRAA